MLSKAQNKYIRSLSQQKYRKEHGVFIAEGDKIAKEWLLYGEDIQIIVALSHWVDENSSLIKKHPSAKLYTVTQEELQTVSALQAAHEVLLVVKTPERDENLPVKEWAMALDEIQDPGNMGTIIRIADWFGIKHVICSPGCVDVYNPKVVQAAMGGHLRVRLHSSDIASYLETVEMPILAAALNGKSVYDTAPLEAAVLMIGNESKGLSKTLMDKATNIITIPRKGGAESLNAAVSAGILCSLLTPR